VLVAYLLDPLSLNGGSTLWYNNCTYTVVAGCTVCTTLNVVNTNVTSLPYANEDLWKVGLPMQDASLCMPLRLGVTDELTILLLL
jgi:hypothetical protein